MLKECDFIIDCNKDNQFVMITQKQFDKIVNKFSTWVQDVATTRAVHPARIEFFNFMI